MHRRLQVCTDFAFDKRGLSVFCLFSAGSVETCAVLLFGGVVWEWTAFTVTACLKCRGGGLNHNLLSQSSLSPRRDLAAPPRRSQAGDTTTFALPSCRAAIAPARAARPGGSRGCRCRGQDLTTAGTGGDEAPGQCSRAPLSPREHCWQPAVRCEALLTRQALRSSTGHHHPSSKAVLRQPKGAG